jgi:6-phosphogluconate dehydrogenase
VSATEASSKTATAKIGVTGLAVMGRNLARNLARHGYPVAVHNRTYAKTESLIADHGEDGTFVPSESLEDFVDSLQKPRVVIVMVKAGPGTDAVIDELVPLLEEGDIVVDTGNSHFTDTVRREAALKEHGLHFVGCGVSGGEEGALNGPSIMPGGSKWAYEQLGPMFESIAAQVDGTPCCVHVGPDGAGHFVKMVHNGIEYGMMQAYAEGFSILKAKTPLDLSLPQISKIWQKGSVVRSWLLDLTADALAKNPSLDGLEAFVPDSGEGRWTVMEAIDLNISAPVITESLIRRLRSREENNFTDRMLSIMRGAFGGHDVKKSQD